LRPMRMKARESALIDFLPNWAGAERKNVCTVKKLAILPFLAGMSPTKISLAGNNLIIPGQREFGW
jgi:hypothetical protein